MTKCGPRVLLTSRRLMQTRMASSHRCFANACKFGACMVDRNPQDEFTETYLTMVRCQYQAAVDQDNLIKALNPNFEDSGKLESQLASDWQSFFTSHADQDSTRKGSRSDPLDKNKLFGSSLVCTLSEIAIIVAQMRNLPQDHEHHHDITTSEHLSLDEPLHYPIVGVQLCFH